MNLVVDIGNTRLKYAFFRQGERMQTGYEREEMFRLLENMSGRVSRLVFFFPEAEK